MIPQKDFFIKNLEHSDEAIHHILYKELVRQRDGLELIASENIVSLAVMQSIGCVFTNKYAEGYSGNRYYAGCHYADDVELLAIERICKLFDAKFANVQPHSGSQANQAVFMSLLKPGDVILGMSLSAGGHLTHGAKPNQSGKWFQAVQYGVTDEGLIDYDEVERLAVEHKPKLIIAGGSAYARIIDFARFRKIADQVGAYLHVDMAHFAGIVAGGLHPNPLPYADVVTSTTHKTLRAARGGLILTNHEDIIKKINSSIFPGIQGGPLVHAITGKAVGFGEALQPEFKTYIRQVVDNAQTLANVLIKGGLNIVSGGTDTHLMLVDLRPKNVTGVVAEQALDRAGITCNKNGIPNDKEKPTVTSGIRLGTPALTTRGFGEAEFILVGEYILEIIDALSSAKGEDISSTEQHVLQKVKELCQKFPIYDIAY